MTHYNTAIPPLHEYYVAGVIDDKGPAYVYAMGAQDPEPHAYIRDLTYACNWPSLEALEKQQECYPCLKPMQRFKVTVTPI